MAGEQRASIFAGTLDRPTSTASVSIDKFHRACRYGNRNIVSMGLAQRKQGRGVLGEDFQENEIPITSTDICSEYIDVPDIYSSTSLMKAASAGHLDIVKDVLGAYADIDRQNIDGQTALMIATGRGHESIIKLLLKRNANPHICDDVRNKAEGYVKKYKLKDYFGDERLLDQLDELDDSGMNENDKEFSVSREMAALRAQEKKLRAALQQKDANPREKEANRHLLAETRATHSRLLEEMASRLSPHDRAFKQTVGTTSHR
jgi:hypothetical protein